MCATSRSAPPRRYRQLRRCWRASAVAVEPYVSLLGSRAHTFFTDGARELFDCAGQGPHRRFLSVRRPDRRRGQHQSGQRRRLRQAEGALSRLVRLGLSLLRRAESDPVPRRAFAPHAGAESRFHQRAGQQAPTMSSAPAGRSRSSPTAACSISTARAAASASRACIPATASPRWSRTPGSISTGQRRCRPRRRRRRKRCDLMRNVVAPQLAEVYPQFAAQVFGVSRGLPEARPVG